MATQIIFLVRHGATDWNKHPKRFQGNIDTFLNKEGIIQAYNLALFFRNIPLAEIISSPLKRALHTAEIINTYHSLPIYRCPNLREMNYGDWEGRSALEIQKKEPYMWTLWQECPEQIKIPKGETLQEVVIRASRVMKKIKTLPGKIKLVVTHGSFIRALISGIFLDKLNFFNKISQSNGAINIIYVEDHQCRLILTNFILPNLDSYEKRAFLAKKNKKT